MMIGFQTPVTAESLCATTFTEAAQAHELSIEVTTERDASSEIIRWRVEGSQGDQGLLVYSIEESGDGPFVFLQNLYGIPGRPHVGRALKQRLRESYPDLPIESYLMQLNRSRLMEAFRVDPLNPDFSNVPAMNALQEAFKLTFNFIENEEGSTILASIELRLVPGNTSGWLNRTEFIADPNFQEWLADQTPTSWEQP